MSLILRKSKSAKSLVPLLRGESRSFGTGATPSAVFAFLLSPIILLVLASVLALALLIAGPGVAIAATAAPFAPDTTLPVTDSIPVVFAGTLAVKLKEAEDAIMGKSKILHEVFEKAGKDVDFNAKPVLELVGAKDSAEVVEKVKAMNKEIDDLGKKRDEIANLKKIEDENTKRLNDPARVLPFPSPTTDPSNRNQPVKSIGRVVVESEAFTNYKKSRTPSECEVKDFGLHELKTLFQTSAGWAPHSPRQNIVIDAVTRPIQVLDIIPTGRMEAAAWPYMEETTRTHAAAERSEGGAYAESTFVLTERSSTARAIGDSIPVTDEQLEDVQGSQSYLDLRLSFGVRQRVDQQVMLGNGTPPNLEGINSKSGVQTQALGGDSLPDAFYKAMTNVRVTGRAFPNAHVIHPTNWQAIRLLKTLDGIYIFGSPSEAGPDRLWGLQVVQFDGTSAGTGWTGDFANFCQLLERRGLEVAVGYVGSQFTEGKKTIRAGVRVAFAIYRAAAFCKVTGLGS